MAQEFHSLSRLIARGAQPDEDGWHRQLPVPWTRSWSAKSGRRSKLRARSRLQGQMATQHLVSMSAAGRRLVVHADGSLRRPLGLNLSLGPNQVWVADITYIAIAAGFVGELSALDEKERLADATL